MHGSCYRGYCQHLRLVLYIADCCSNGGSSAFANQQLHLTSDIQVSVTCICNCFDSSIGTLAAELHSAVEDGKRSLSHVVASNSFSIMH